MPDDLAQLFKLYQPALQRFVLSRVKSREDAEEIVQESFIKYKEVYLEKEVAAPQALLAKIARNIVIDRVRERNSRERREREWGNTNIEDTSDCLPCGTSSAHQARSMEARQEIERVIDCLKTLPVKTRRIFFLHRFEGLSHREIEEKTGIPRSTIEKHMIKAIRTISAIRNE